MKKESLLKWYLTFQKWKFIAITIFMASAFVISGCTVVARDTRPARKRKVVVTPSGNAVVYVKKTPPKVIVETPPPRPHTSAIWISGCWKWNGKKYVWVNGYWDNKPQGKEWVPGIWEKTPRGWVWRPGYWR